MSHCGHWETRNSWYSIILNKIKEDRLLLNLIKESVLWQYRKYRLSRKSRKIYLQSRIVVTSETKKGGIYLTKIYRKDYIFRLEKKVAFLQRHMMFSWKKRKNGPPFHRFKVYICVLHCFQQGDNETIIINDISSG